MPDDARFTGSTSAFATKALRHSDTETVRAIAEAIDCLKHAHGWADEERDAIADLITSASAILRNITE